MLRSTGFFRGIDCPFYFENNNGKAGTDGCSRPYCHFRHSKQRRAASGIYDIKKAKAQSASSNDQAYDPFSPEVVRPGQHYDGEPPSRLSAGQDVDLGNMELELVNRAIEAVRSEMEREKKKLSRIGDQEYEPTTSSVTRPKPPASSHQGYDPGSYQMGQVSEYTPSPRSSKYTLDSDSSSKNANALEYVPTAVSKTRVKKVLPPPPSHVKCKYTLDNSKPTTDMEYDPPPSRVKCKYTLDNSKTTTDMEYDPPPSRGKCKYTLDNSKTTTDMEYDPPPSRGKCKYTLDSSKPTSDMEYDPPPSRGKCKYTLDNSKPTTDMEYDPPPSRGKCKYTLDNSKPTTDMEYDPPPSRGKCKYTLDNSKPTTDMEYDPPPSRGKGKYTLDNSKLTTEMEYDPTPSRGKCKYTLDSSKPTTDTEYDPPPSRGKSKYTLDNSKPTTDMEYDPPPSRVKCKYTLDNSKPTTDMEYDPPASRGKCKYTLDNSKPTTEMEYDPTPSRGKCKYTLDSSKPTTDTEYDPPPSRGKSKYTLDNSKPTTDMEYDPPPSRVKCKYTLDNSKPTTDMEYDPLSNYSAKLTVKEQRTLCSEEEGRKRFYPKKQREDEEYVPTAKKPRSSPPKADVPKYTASFSESDEESSGTEYRPMSISRLQRKGINIGLKQEWESGLMGQQRKQFSKLEDGFSQSESDDIQDAERADKKIHKKVFVTQLKNVKSDKPKKEEKEPNKKSPKERLESSSVNKMSKNSSKKEKNQSKTVDGSSKSKEKVRKDGTESKSNDDKNKKIVKIKSEHSQREKERGSGDIKKPKTDKPVKNDKVPSKFKNQKNGKLESSAKEKDKKRSSHGSGSTNSSSIKDRSKKKNSSILDRKEARETKKRNLSHADLFGAESVEEDDEEDERIVRKSASAFKRGSLINNKRKTSEDTSSSSEDNSEVDDDDGGGGGGDEAVDYSCLQDEMEYDSDPMEECLRIFNESKEVKTEDKGRQAKQSSREQEDDDEEEETESTLTTLFPGQKKRVSHFKVQGKSETSLNAVPMQQRRMTAQEICYQRMQKAQQQAAQLAAAVKIASASTNPVLGLSGEKRRVAHRPNASLPSSKPRLADASRQVLSPTRVTDQLSIKAQTSAGILSKTTSTTLQKRVAHTPTMKSSAMKRPVIPAEFGAKVPTNVRQRYLNIFIDECLKFCSSEQEAFKMALEEEKVVYDRSSSKNIYLNVAVNTLKKLRSKSTPTSPALKTPAVSVNKKAQSHEEVLGGRLAATTSYTINRSGKQQDVDLKGTILYKKLKKYAMTEEQLQEHGYPRPHPEMSGHACVHNLPEKKNNDPFSKICSRCGAEYKINANGSCVRKEECSHHWGRLRRNRVPGGWETLYSCCSGAVGSPGCEVCKQHVQDGRKESLDGFVKTFSKPLPADGNAGVYALDCEMCYTKQGLELTRVTVINSDLKVIYDTFVKPGSKVVDYNTRFSGVTQDDLENTTITLRDVQAVLLSMFSAKSILIGHSLESDLFALKLIHSMVVDTAIVFPHRLGLPYKRALRNLMADYLKRIIQDSVEGHDSSEDARACMELMVWKLKEDAKVKR
ncbi:RNA exonuclease 1 homolog [Pseudorasbora parva]|uniref:RNA exonuclease 1 homolog n=1 Tax=Pseudorasbora parva TaxID=51549 RepID=UPI00351F67E1